IAPGTTRGYVMSGGTQHPEAAWRWLSFLSRKDVRGLISDTNDLAKFVIPARRSVAEGTNFWGRLDPEARAALEALIQQRATAQYPDLPGLYNNWWYQPLRDALSEVIEQKAPPEQALATAQATFEQQRNAWLARPTPTPDPQPFVVATPVPNVAAAGATRIKFGVTRSLENQVRAVAERFNQEQQAIFLELRIDSDSRSVSDMTSGNDCFAWPAPPTAADTAAVLDLQPLLDADPNLPGSDFPAPLLAPFQHAGGTFGLPLRVTVPTLGYNQALFTAGVATPTATWSPDDLLRAAQQLSSGSGEERRYGYASASGDLTAEVDFWLARFGASLSSGSGDGWKPTFTDPKTVAATRFIITLLRESSPHTALTGYSSATRFNDSRGSELIGAGRVALWLNQFNTGLPDSPTASYSPAIGPPPLGSEGFSPDDLEVSGLYIKVVTPHMQACWQWLKTLSNSLNQLEASPNRPLRLPARVALVALPADPATASVFNATRTAFERPARPRVLLPELNPYWFYRALDRALQGGDLEQELADAQFLTEQYLACVRGGEEAATCATQVDPTYDGFSQ
ncbi:MAG: extracellular solute-binding protein, partial [Chloroflexaceae bacterium]|nr:extracellular solute-binding protein [Chloroflexaceae bacterium]